MFHLSLICLTFPAPDRNLSNSSSSSESVASWPGHPQPSSSMISPPQPPPYQPPPEHPLLNGRDNYGITRESYFTNYSINCFLNIVHLSAGAPTKPPQTSMAVGGSGGSKWEYA